jgi:hypothetical protein
MPAIPFAIHQDQIRVLVNHYGKKQSPQHDSLEQIRQTRNQPVFYGIPDSPLMLASVNKGRPMVGDRQAAGDQDRVHEGPEQLANARTCK